MKKKTFKKIILDDLKSQGLQSIAKKITSITYDVYAGGSSVRVESLNLFKSERETLDKVLNEYQEGHFDGMHDIYQYKSTSSTKERMAKYVLPSNSFSKEVEEKVKAVLHKEYGVTDNETSQKVMSCWYDQAVFRMCQQLED